MIMAKDSNRKNIHMHFQRVRTNEALINRLMEKSLTEREHHVSLKFNRFPI